MKMNSKTGATIVAQLATKSGKGTGCKRNPSAEM